MCDGLLFYKDKSSISNMFENFFQNYFQNPVKAGLKMIWRHPLKAFSVSQKSRKLRERAYSLPDSDPMKKPLKALAGIADSLEYEIKFDAQSIFDYAIGIFEINYENGMTYASQQQVLESILGFMNLVPAGMRTEIKRIASVDCGDKDVRLLTAGDISRIYVSCYINANYQCKEAVEQSRRIVQIEKTLRAPGDIRIIEALMKSGYICTIFGMYGEAISSYKEAYEILKASAPDSAILRNTCFDIISCISNLNSPDTVDWAWIDEVRTVYSGFYGELSANTTFANGIIAEAMLNAVFNYFNNGKGTPVTPASIRAAIYEYIPRFTEKIADENYFSLPQKDRSAEVLNSALKERLYPDNMDFLLTGKDIERLGRDGTVYEIARRVRYALAAKLGDIKINVGIRIGYKAVNIEKALFENIFYKVCAEQFANGGRSEEEFKDNILNCLCGEILKFAANRHYGKYFYSYDFMDMDIRAGRSDLVYTNIPREGQPDATLPEREYIEAPENCGIKEEFKQTVHSYYCLADTGLACERFFEMMRNKKSVSVFLQTIIWTSFENVLTYLTNITTVNRPAVIMQKCKNLYEECLDVCKYLSVNGKTGLLRTRAYISYNFQLGRKAGDKGLKYFRAVIKKAVQKHILPGQPLHFSAVKSLCGYAETANGDLAAFADSLLGKSGKNRTKFDALVESVLSGHDVEISQIKKDIFENIYAYIKSSSNYSNNYGISNADFRKIKSEKEYYYNVLRCAIYNIW